MARSVLQDFFDALRSNRFQVSIPDQIDAMRAVELLGWGDREVVKYALGAILAKGADEMAAFEGLFELFFRPPSRENRPAPPHDAQGIDVAALKVRLNAASADAGIGDIWLPSHKTGAILKLQAAMGLAPPETPGSAANAAGTRRLVQRMVVNHVNDHIDLHGAARRRSFNEDRIAESRIGAIAAGDRERMHDVVKAAAARLARRRLQRVGRPRPAELDIRRIIRSSLATDGVPFELHWRTRRRKLSPFLVLCDISGSMRESSALLLRFLHSFAALKPALRSFVFVGGLIEVTGLFTRQPVEAAISTVLRKAAGSSDYGRALGDLRSLLGEQYRKGTTVLILGDARNNDRGPRLDALRDISRRVRRLIWLNPEPVANWGSGDSDMPAYAPFCQAVHPCGSIRELEQALDSVLAAHFSV